MPLGEGQYHPGVEPPMVQQACVTEENPGSQGDMDWTQSQINKFRTLSTKRDSFWEGIERQTETQKAQSIIRQDKGQGKGAAGCR